MTSDSIFDGEIDSSADFEAALHDLLVAALGNDIDPRGSWEYRADGLPSDLEVMVMELQARDANK